MSRRISETQIISIDGGEHLTILCHSSHGSSYIEVKGDIAHHCGQGYRDHRNLAFTYKEAVELINEKRLSQCSILMG